MIYYILGPNIQLFLLQRVKFKIFLSSLNILIRVVFVFPPPPFSTTVLTRSSRDGWRPLRLWIHCAVSWFLKRKFCDQTKLNQTKAMILQGLWLAWNLNRKCVLVMLVTWPAVTWLHYISQMKPGSSVKKGKTDPFTTLVKDYTWEKVRHVNQGA